LDPALRRVATGGGGRTRERAPELVSVLRDSGMGDLLDEKGERMASAGREILDEHYDDDHLTYEEITGLGLRVVTENGEAVPTDELRGKIFRIIDRDEASGYVVSPTETTGTAAVLSYLRAS